MLDFPLYMVVMAFVYTAPVIVLVLLGRRRIGRRLASALLMLAFACTTGFSLWRIEWFDVWRHGVPRISYILSAYGPWVMAFASVGWIIGSLIVRPTKAEKAIEVVRN